jgi:phospholipase C
MGFAFDRLGVRLPAIAVSPWISERTVVKDVYHHTALIRTMRERWSLGNPFTGRDAGAPLIGPVLTRDEPRGPDEWPDVDPQPVPDFDEALIPLDARCHPWRRRSSEGASHSPASSINPCLTSHTLTNSRAGRR